MSQRVVELGDRAKDQITGFTGIVVAITEWLNGCIRVTIQPAELHEGKPVESWTFDIEQIAKCDGVGFRPETTPSGGPKSAPSRNPTPTRR